MERNGVRIFIASAPGLRKQWAWIETTDGPAPFSFRDWFDMVQAVCKCEIGKYAGEVTDEAWERWTRLLREFVAACFTYNAEYELLRRRFGLPR